MLVQFQGMIAEYERAQIAERCRRGKKHMAQQGGVNVLSGAPFGYRYVKKSDTSAAFYEVVEAEDGMSALERYFVAKPDVVVLDLVMKGMYGLDVLAKLREMDQTAKIIVVSADVQTSSQRLVNDAGAAGFLIKPLEADQILPLIRTALAGAGKCN